MRVLLRLNVLSQMSHRYFFTFEDLGAVLPERRAFASAKTPDEVDEADDVEPASKEQAAGIPKRKRPA